MLTYRKLSFLLSLGLVCLALALSSQPAVMASEDPPPKPEMVPAEPGVEYRVTVSAVVGETGFTVESAPTRIDHAVTTEDSENRAQPRASWTTIFSDDFEGPFPGTDWIVHDNDGTTNGELYWDDDDYKPYSGLYSVWPAAGGADGVDPEFSYYRHNMDAWMFYGPFSLDDAADADLTFKYWGQTEENYDYFHYMASVDNSNYYGYAETGDSGGWVTKTFDLTSVPTLGDLTGEDYIWIAFRFYSDPTNWDDGPFVDDVLIQKNTPVPATPSSIDATDGTDYDHVFIYTPPVYYATFYKYYSNTTSNVASATYLGQENGTGYFQFFPDPGVKTYYWAEACNSSGCSTKTGYDTGFAKHPYVDFDSDNDTDVSVYRPSNGRWYFSGGGYVAYGIPGDRPVAGDYDGDGDTDVAIYRPSTGRWYIKDIGAFGFGISGDIPMQCDYDGDGIDEIAIYRPSNGRWYIKDQGYIAYGIPGDIPVPGDYDGDGDCDVAVYRPSTGVWYIYGQAGIPYGIAGDIPIPGDWDGNGSADIAIFRPGNGRWYVYGQGLDFYGIPGDIPIPADYDGDGDVDIAVYRPSTGYWYIKDQFGMSYGIPGDYPVMVRDTNLDGDPHE